MDKVNKINNKIPNENKILSKSKYENFIREIINTLTRENLQNTIHINNYHLNDTNIYNLNNYLLFINYIHNDTQHPQLDELGQLNIESIRDPRSGG